LIEQLEAGHSEGLTAYLTAMGRFHNYSFGNILEIARQRSDATRVAGMYAWNQLGRRVKKGERGIRILAPVIGSRRKPDAEAEKDIRTQNQPILVGFRSVYVFDVAQTEGKELPELASKVSGNVGEYRERLFDFAIAQGIQIEFKESIAPALGMSYGGRIALLPGQGSAEEFSTLVHELAYEMLYKAERRTATTKTVRETEAEAIWCGSRASPPHLRRRQLPWSDPAAQYDRLAVGAEDRSRTQIRSHASPGCGRRTEPKAARQPLGSGRRGRLAGSGVESPGAGFFLRAGTVSARGGVRRQECAVACGDAPDLWIGGADLRVSRPAKGEGRLGRWTEFLGEPAA